MSLRISHKQYLSTSYRNFNAPNKMTMYNISPLLAKIKIAYIENFNNKIDYNNTYSPVK